MYGLRIYYREHTENNQELKIAQCTNGKC
jgi:hypothetical protein